MFSCFKSKETLHVFAHLTSVNGPGYLLLLFHTSVMTVQYLQPVLPTVASVVKLDHFDLYVSKSIFYTKKFVFKQLWQANRVF